MKKILTLFIFVFITITIFGKQVVPKYVNGPKGVIICDKKTNQPLNGKHELLEYDSQFGDYIFMEGTFKKGLYDGKITTYTVIGNIYNIAEYKNGVLHGHFEGIYINPKTNLPEIISCEYKDGKKTGEYITYYTLFDEKDFYIANYDILIKGYKEIITGKKREEKYINDIKNGITKEWYSNGQLQTKGNFKNGELDGLLEAWHKNGQLEGRANLKNGQANGLVEEWYENGQLKERGNYKNRKLNGSFETWYENGQLQISCNLKDDQLDGSFKAWYENSQLKVQDYFQNGKSIERKEYNEDGSLRN